ncbi:MAG: hypothetical protein KF853_05895 [Rhodocyclaceae bacterium]|nr:hypothetical protein [Rhodocyclaceae bacterium]
MRYDDRRPDMPEPSLLGRILGIAAGAVLLVAALMFSVVVFAFALAAGLLVWGWLWWKTREVRRQMREQMAAQRMGEAPSGDAWGEAQPGGRVIEGEVIRDEEGDDGRR